MQLPNKLKLTQKQFIKIPLFRNVRQINGDKIFKSLYEMCKIITYQTRTADHLLSLKQNFIYVKEGQIFIYKILSGDSNRANTLLPAKSLIKSYRTEEYCGFQDYPLFWGENFLVQVSANTTLVLVPLGQFYKFFRRVIPMTYLQSKAEYLKKLPLFRGVQLQKIFKIACLSQKFRVTKQKTIIREGDTIQNIFIICSGKVQLISTAINQTIICSQNQDVLVKEVKQNVPISLFTIKCLQESDILSIPKDEFKKIIDIRFKLKQTIQKQVINTMNLQQMEKIQTQLSEIPSRPRYSTLYSQSLKSRPNTSKYDRTRLKSAKKSSMFTEKSKETQIQQQLSKQNNYSLGQIQLLKFIRRKEKVENRNFYKYIESRAPEIILNPSKPFYKSSSQYVRNMKRKIKHSLTNNTNQNCLSAQNFTDFIL